MTPTTAGVKSTGRAMLLAADLLDDEVEEEVLEVPVTDGDPLPAVAVPEEETPSPVAS